MDETFKIQRPPADTDWMKMRRPSSGDVGDYMAVAGTQLPEQEKDFNFQLKYGQNNQLLRAQAQPWFEQVGKTIGNTAANIVTGVVGDIGRLGTLTEWGDHRDYSNWLTEAMDKAQNPFGEVYRENPEKTFDFTDPAWWEQQIGGLVEGAGKFGVEAWLTGGAGGEGLFGSLARAAGSSRLALGTAQGASAATIGYTWAAESAAHIYKQAYDHNYQMLTDRGLDPAEADKQAKHVASSAAASTAQIGTVFNTLFGLTSLAPLFKQSGADAMAKEFMEGTLAKAEGEGVEAYSQRLKNTDIDAVPELKEKLGVRNFWSSYPSQAIQMTGMGLGTQYAEKEGERVADGKGRPLLQQLTDLSQMIDDNANEEGLLNAAIGFLAGPLHAYVMDKIPSKRVARYDEYNNPIAKKGTDGELIPDGKGGYKFETRLVTPKSYQEDGTRRYFRNVADAITADIDNFTKLNGDLLKAVQQKNDVEADRIRNEIFAVGARDAVLKGITRHWQQTFREIANTDNTKPLSEKLQPQIDAIDQQLEQAVQSGDEAGVSELQKQKQGLLHEQAKVASTTEAMQKGFAKDMNDHEYKQKAIDAAADLEHLEKMHQQVQKDYADELNPASGELADNIFYHQSRLYLWKKVLDRYREHLAAREAELSVLDPTGELGNALLEKARKELETEQSSYDAAAGNFKELISPKGQREFMKAVAEKNKAQQKQLNDENNAAHRQQLLRQREKEAAAEMDEKSKAALRSKNDALIAEHNQRLIELQDKYNQAQHQIDELKKSPLKNAIRIQKLRSEQREHRKAMDSYTAQLNNLRRQQELLGIQHQQAQAKTEEVKQQTIQEDKTEDKNEGDTNFTIDDLLNMQEEPETKPETKTEAKSPEEDYFSLVDKLPEPVIRELDKLAQEFRGKEFRYDKAMKELRKYIGKDFTEAEARDAAVRLDKYLQWQEQHPQVQAAEPTTASAAELIHEDDVPQIPEPDSPVINIQHNLEEGTDETTDFWRNGRKTVDAYKGNTSMLQYLPLKKADGSWGLKTVFNSKGEPQLDPKFVSNPANLQLLVPGAVAMGDSLSVHMDENFSGEKLNPDKIEIDKYGKPVYHSDEFKDYLDESGKIRMEALPGEAYPAYASIPIRIVHDKTGAVTYLPKAEWITAQQGVSGFRNVDPFPMGWEDMVDSQGKKLSDLYANNVQYQEQELLKLRKMLAERYNSGDKTPLKNMVTDRTDGNLLRTEENSKTGRKFVARLTETQLPDKTLVFGVMEPKDGKPTPFIGHRQEFDRQIVPMSDDQLANFSGAPFVALPMPSGRYRIEPLKTRTFAERKGDLNTVVRAIELYYKHGTEHWDETDQKHLDLIGKTGFDITTEQGLRDFINQHYTYTHNGFEDAIALANGQVVNGKLRDRQFLFSVPDKAEGYPKTLIKVGEAYSGQKPIYAELDKATGKLDSRFEDALRKGLEGRFKNVTYKKGNLTGVNDDRTITAVRINTDGSTWSKTYPTYNDYLKTFTETSVWGGMKVGDKYVYSANSQVLLDKKMFTPEKKTPAEIQLPHERQAAEDAALEDLLSLIDSNYKPEYAPQQKISPEGEPVSLESLRELHSFTDESERNGKTPEEVMQYLQDLGITHLTDGYNPFIKC